jgi:hypothetical protein
MNDLPTGERLAKLRALEEWLDWQLEPARDRRTVLHRGGCGIWKGETAFLERGEVLLALEDDSLVVEMCGVCNPESGLRSG